MSKSVAATVGVADLPQELIADDARLRSFVRECIKNAVAMGMEPALDGHAPQTRKSLMTHLTAQEASYVLGLMQKQGVKVPIAAAVGRLAEAGMSMTVRPVVADGGQADALGRALGLAGLPPAGRTEQRALFQNISRALSGSEELGPIVAAQASTGTGKTFIAQAVAMQAVEARPGAVCVVAFPTLHGVKVFAEQWHKTWLASDRVLPRLALLFGRGEYVSEEAVEEVAAELDDDGKGERAEALRAWAAEQKCKSPDDLVPAWMMDSLLTVDEQLDRDSLAINAASADSDAGVLAYRAQFQRANGARVIACSHAMLAVDVLIRWKVLTANEGFRDKRETARQDYFSDEERETRALMKASGQARMSFEEVMAELCLAYEQAQDGSSMLNRKLPVYDHLIVDEAHLLEQAFSNIFSRSVSLKVTHSTLGRLKAMGWHGSKGKLEEAHQTAGAVVDQLITVGKDGEELRINDMTGERSREIKASLGALLESIDSVRPPPEGSTTLVSGLWAKVQHDADTLRQALKSADAGQKLLSFTPVKLFPHLVVGSGNVKQPLNILWARLRSGVLLSATIYLRKEEGWSARYCGTVLLGVPASRLKEIEVVQSPWLYTPVTGLYVPERVERTGVKGHWLCPPSRKDKLLPEVQKACREAWDSELAAAVKWVFRSGAGGSLVLCTSIEHVNDLGARLEAEFGGSVPVLLSTRLKSLQKLRRAALEHAMAGRRALLVATGGGWTGFDVSGKDAGFAPEVDNVITDLVVTRIPFGMNRSLTHRTRVENPREAHQMHEAIAAGIMFQQGIGRLVRADGIPANRRIFVLDGRMNDPVMSGYVTPVRRAMVGYRQKVLTRNEIG